MTGRSTGVAYKQFRDSGPFDVIVIYGLAHSPARFESRDLRPRTPLRGLYLTGQDVGTCGVMGALSGAVATASVMLRRNLFGEISKAA